MSLHTHQTVNGDTTAFKCWRSIAKDGAGQRHNVVYVEIYEGYTTPGYACGEARRTTRLRLTRETLEDLAHYFTQLAEHGEADQSPQNAALKSWAGTL